MLSTGLNRQYRCDTKIWPPYICIDLHLKLTGSILLDNQQMPPKIIKPILSVFSELETHLIILQLSHYVSLLSFAKYFQMHLSIHSPSLYHRHYMQKT